MLRCHLSPGKAIAPPDPKTWFAVVALVLAGCSSRPLATAPPTDPASIGREAQSASLPRKQETVVVTLSEDQDAAALASEYGAVLVESGWQVAGLQSLTTTTDALLDRLKGDSRVLTAELNAVVETAEARQKSWAFDDGWGSPEACQYQPATSSCRLGAAHDLSEGEGVRVAVIDTGAELAHPWLQPRVVGGYDFVSEDADPSDTADAYDNDYDGWVDEAVGHGTHVAGVVALAAPQAGLLIARVLDSDGRGDMMSVARAIRWAVANGARVINLSLGSLAKSEAVKLALEEAVAAGAVPVAAAGNWGALEPEEFPASSRYAIAVAALGDADQLASFSSHGTYVSLSAPGTAIRSSYRNGGYALWSGTSMAAPWVSGGAALLLARHPEWTRKQVLDRLEITARDISVANPSLTDYLGAGALDLGAALEADLVVPAP